MDTARFKLLVASIAILVFPSTLPAQTSGRIEGRVLGPGVHLSNSSNLASLRIGAKLTW